MEDRLRIHAGIDMGITEELVRFLAQHIHGGEVTLETGCGLSTLTLLRGRVARHVAITPFEEEFRAVREACAERGVSTEPLEAIAERSEDYLPTASLPDLDLVLIDGDHAFPIPFLDWYYTADALRVGGTMVVDDVEILTGMMLADFMAADPCWRELMRTARFAVYEKRAHPARGRGWWEQPYLNDCFPAVSLVGQKEPSAGPGPFERTMARILPWRFVQKPLLARFNWPRRS